MGWWPNLCQRWWACLGTEHHAEAQGPKAAALGHLPLAAAAAAYFEHPSLQAPRSELLRITSRNHHNLGGVRGSVLAVQMRKLWGPSGVATRTAWFEGPVSQHALLLSGQRWGLCLP